MSSDIDDPEASYRRGYHQGAFDVIAAVSEALSEVQRKELEKWLNGPVYKWRLENLRGKDLNRADSNPPSIPPRHLLKIKSR